VSHDDIGCLAAIEMFYAYLDGELDDPESIADFERHMEHCRSCFTRAEMEGLLNERLRKLARHRAPDRLKSRLHDLMDRF
jgi:anti-sigma factor (TIGR02949 family)